MPYNKRKHHRRSIRLPGYDYTLPGTYFVTIRVHDGEHQTGFPVQATTRDTVTVTRFPLPRIAAFELPAVRYIAGTEEDPAG